MSNTDCRFCNGEAISCDDVGEGIQTMSMMVDAMFENLFGYTEKKKNDYLKNGIQLQRGNRLCFDSSAREYAVLDIEIRYCPFCGKELEPEIL